MTGVEITEFLLARVAEDEADAPDILYDSVSGHPRSLRARVLAECEAKRRIVGFEDQYRARLDAPEHRRGLFDGRSYIDVDGRHLTGEAATAFIEQWYKPSPPSPALRALAAVYADHPDYRQEWKP